MMTMTEATNRLDPEKQEEKMMKNGNPQQQSTIIGSHQSSSTLFPETKQLRKKNTLGDVMVDSKTKEQQQQKQRTLQQQQQQYQSYSYPLELDYYIIANTKYSHGCISVKNRDTTRGTPLILENCNPQELSMIWRIDNLGRFHTALDDSMCMQVGYYGAVYEDGVPLRIDHCEEETKDSQVFFWDINTQSASSPILTTFHDDDNSRNFCVTFRGIHANIKKSNDPIILKECSNVDNHNTLENRFQWNNHNNNNAVIMGGRFCPGGDWCPYQYDCYKCQNQPSGGICLNDSESLMIFQERNNNDINTRGDNTNRYYEELCNRMNGPGAGRICGGKDFCPTENYCVDCSIFLGYHMTGHVCLHPNTQEFLEPCLLRNGIVS